MRTLASALFAGIAAYVIWKYVIPYSSNGPQFETTGPLLMSASSTSLAGQAFIKSQEGLRLTPYFDYKGYTVGYGHQITSGDNIGQTQTISTFTANRLFSSDIANVDNAIRSYVKVPLTQNQWDALADFIFNEGAGHFATSTLLKYLNEGNYSAASEEFKRWRFAGGVSNPTLEARRASEQTLFNT